MRAKRSLYNLITAVGTQVVILVLGLIVPRLTLTNYGSETNGFMSLVVQIYAYIGLLEAGLGTAEVQALYGPVTAGDRRAVSCVVNTAHGYYRRLTGYYAGAVVAVAAVLPLVVESELSPWVMSVYFLLFGLARVTNFWFAASMRPLLQVEGKNYVNTGIDFAFNVGATLARIALLSMGVGLILLQIVYSLINTLQVLVYFFYFRRYYGWVDRTVPPDRSVLKQRNAFFLQQVSQMVFSCTDVILISVFCDLKAASVYAVYMLVFNALHLMIWLMFSNTQFVLGQVWHEDRKRYVTIHQAFDAGLVTVGFILNATACVLMLPFVELYTAGVTDADYLDGLLPLLLCMNGVLTTCKYVPLNLINVAHHAKQTMGQTLGEMVLNLGLSLVLVPVWGIRGVLAGTFAALAFRVIAGSRYANRKLLNVSSGFSLRLYLSNFLLFGAVVLARQQIPLSITSYPQFILAGFATVAVMAVLFGGLNLALNHALLMPYVKWAAAAVVRRMKS